MRRTLLIAFILAVIAQVAVQGPAGAAAREAGFAVIVHPDVQGNQIPRAILSSLFLRDVVRWKSGDMVRPVDQSLSSPLRETFTRNVLSVPIDGVPRFWHAKIMRGISPPPVKSSDAEVVEYVATTEGAIGYVSVDAAVPATVKELDVID